MGWTLRSAFQPTLPAGSTGRLEALATWIEASVTDRRPPRPFGRHRVDGDTPAAMTRPVAHLIVRLKSGSRPRGALYAFTRADFDDAAADEAIAPLIWPARFGGSDLGQTSWPPLPPTPTSRSRCGRGQRTEVARAKPPSRDMRLVIALTLVFTLGVLDHRPRLLQAVRHPRGPARPSGGRRAGDFAGGFWAMNRLSRPGAHAPSLFGEGGRV